MPLPLSREQPAASPDVDEPLRAGVVAPRDTSHVAPVATTSTRRPLLATLADAVAWTVAASAIDAVSGRLLHAHADPFTIVVAALAGWTITEAQPRLSPRDSLALGGGIGLVYFALFWLWAHLLVGWNFTPPWHAAPATIFELVVAGVFGAWLSTVTRARVEERLAAEGNGGEADRRYSNNGEDLPDLTR